MLREKGSGKDPFSHLGLVIALLALFSFYCLTFPPYKTRIVSAGDNLQASLVGTSLLQDILEKNTPSSSDSNKLFVGLPIKETQESPDLFFVQQNSLVAFSPPSIVTTQSLGSILEEETTVSNRDEIIEYVVEDGDSLASIAEKFDISLDTLLWANDLVKGSKIKPGQVLIILPVSGAIHYVKKGDTISGIAKTYKAEKDSIISFNNLVDENDIYIGDIVIIPGGKVPTKLAKTKTFAPSDQIPVASSYFICPVVGPCKLTQGLHWHNAVDFGSKCSNPVYAAAGGQVQRVRYGWNGGAGNYVMLSHPNGLVTFYGHLTESLVSQGGQVSQGQVIALSGGKPGTSGAGLTTGCHLHFEVRGGTNPFAR